LVLRLCCAIALHLDLHSSPPRRSSDLDLWPYRGIEDVTGPAPMGHEYVGVVEEVGPEVRTVRPGQFVVGSFFELARPHSAHLGADRKSTRLNSSHQIISYAVFCLRKKK